MRCFTKTGEWLYSRESLLDTGVREGRPRQIWGPSKCLKSLPGWLNRFCLKGVKKILPSVICGYNNDDLSEKITRDKLRLINKFGWKNVKTFTFDGSSHDSHQHARIISAVDTVFFDQFADKLMKDYNIPSDVRSVVMDCVTSDAFDAQGSYVDNDGIERRLYDINISGTTFSGHPTRTTLGNSLRTLLYVCFLLMKVGFGEDARLAFFGKSDNIMIYVAGDDVIVFGRADMVAALYNGIYITHAHNTE